MALAPVPDNPPVPPQDLQAEEHVLGSIMLTPAAAIPACREILTDQGSEFYRESHARIWRAALALSDRGEPVDAITLTDWLERTGELEQIGGRVRLHELAALVPATANVAHYADIVRRRAVEREIITVGARIQRIGWEGAGADQDVTTLVAEAHELVAQLDRGVTGTSALAVETWAEFERTATEQIPMLVDGLWPEAGLGFIAAPPKKGKTWLGLSLAASVATGHPFLATFQVDEPQPVVLLALEGHRAAIRGRIGCLARGLGLDPQTDELLRRNLHIAYKPAGINLADPAWIRTVRDLAQRVGARILIVDVLRAAAILKENSNDEFRDLVRALQPLQADGCAIAMLHHFGKLTEISKDRTPGERMAGAGAMYGAFDVGVFITKSDQGARELRVEFETRDVVAPDPIGLYLDGEPSGRAGGFVFADAASWRAVDAPEPEVVKAPADEIADYVREQGGEVLAADVRRYFTIDSKTLDARVSSLWAEHQIEYVGGRGRPARLLDRRPPLDPQMTLAEFGSDQVRDSRTSTDSRTFPLNHAESDEFGSSGMPTPELTPELEKAADMQAETSSGVPPSPTEREEPAHAAPLSEGVTPTTADADIDWSRP